MTREEVIRSLEFAIEIAGGGGCSVFTSEEYSEMYAFLEELRTAENQQSVTGGALPDLNIVDNGNGYSIKPI